MTQTQSIPNPLWVVYWDPHWANMRGHILAVHTTDAAAIADERASYRITVDDRVPAESFGESRVVSVSPSPYLAALLRAGVRPGVNGYDQPGLWDEDGAVVAGDASMLPEPDYEACMDWQGRWDSQAERRIKADYARRRQRLLDTSAKLTREDWLYIEAAAKLGLTA